MVDIQVQKSWATTCTNCQSPPDVLCRTAQCYQCFKSRVLRIFKQTFRTKIMSKVNSLLAESHNQPNTPSKMDDNCCGGDKIGKRRLKIGVVCAGPRYGLGRGLYAAKLLLHLLLMRNAHRKRLFDYSNINDGILDNLLVTDDIEIVGLYIIEDPEFVFKESGNIGSKIPVNKIHIQNTKIFKKIDEESLDAGTYCRNLEAINLVKSIPVDVVLAPNCLEDVALASLSHSMLGLGGDNILRNQYVQIFTSSTNMYNSHDFCESNGFLGRPFRDLTAKEIYLLARHEKLINTSTDHMSINYIYQMEFILEIGTKHPNSLINIAKLTEGNNLKQDLFGKCPICKFIYSTNSKNSTELNICCACLEVSNASATAKSYLFSNIAATKHA